MAITLKRKLYPRGGSFETTVPMQLLFSIDTNKKNSVLFKYDKATNRWYIEFEEDSAEFVARIEDSNVKFRNKPSAGKLK